MYTNPQLIRTIKCLFVGLFFFSVGCSKFDESSVKLDSSLKTYYELIEDGITGAARVRLRQFMTNQGESSQPLFLMGLSYHKEKKYTKAAEWFERSVFFVTAQNRYSPTWHFLGWSYYYLGDAEKSKAAFEQFLRFYPNEGDSLFALGLLAIDAGDNVKAEDFLNEAIAVQRDNPKGQAKAMARLGDVFALKENVEQARKMYKQAVDLDPDLYEAWFRLANTYKQKDNAIVQEYLRKSREAKQRVNQSRYKTSFPE